MSEKYRIIFNGNIIPTQNIDEVKQKIATVLYKGDISRVERSFFKGKTVLIRKGLDYQTALKLKTTLITRIGAIFEIELENQHISREITNSQPENQSIPSSPDIQYEAKVFQNSMPDNSITKIILENKSPETSSLEIKSEDKMSQSPIDDSSILQETRKEPVLSLTQKLDLKSIRYPKENLFLMIVWFPCILLGIGFTAIVFHDCILLHDFSPLIDIGIFIVIFYLFYKVTFLWVYWFIYGNSVQVSQSQYPEVYQAVERACEFIQLKETPEIFVLHGAGLLEVFVLKYMIKRGMVVFTAEIVETLLEQGDSRQLMMLIGRQLGHIKAGHFRWWFAKDVIGRLTFWGWKAWRRRCHLTADRIGMLVAGDFEAAQRALISITVGKHLSDKTNLQSIVDQKNYLRGHFWARIMHLFCDYPYMIYRITELSSFRYFLQTRSFDSTKDKEIGFLPPIVSIFQISVGKKFEELQSQYDIMSERIKRMRNAYAIETSVTERFKLEKQIEAEEQERTKIESRIVKIESFYIKQKSA